MNDPAFMEGTLFVVTFDENDDIMAVVDNQVYTVMVGPMVRAGNSMSDELNHYSVLRMVEDNFGLGSLSRQDASAPAIHDIWK